MALLTIGPAQAEDFGPFFVRGFVKGEEVRVSNYCVSCQRVPTATKEQVWADEIVPGRPYGAATRGTLLVQPWVGARIDLGKGFKAEALASQRWRNGKEDFPGFLYEENVALSHEDYGSLRVGAMTTRAWSMADYPYATNLSLSDAWASGGAGYGLLTRAVRYTSRVLDVADGDMVLEATYDEGKNGWQRNRPRFLELWGRYQRGDLLLNGMLQVTRNGTPSAFGHGIFTGLTPFASDDPKLGSSGQGIAMLMATYQYNTRVELNAGLRYNWWSGAYAVITEAGPPAQWNNMFNVDWGGTRDGVTNPGYPARSFDLSLGARYKLGQLFDALPGQWFASGGLVYLGRASTPNPSDRAKSIASNSALIPSVKLQYDAGRGISVYLFAGLVQYGHLGLAPMSMPANSSFTNVDSRVSRTGSWTGIGAVYVF